MNQILIQKTDKIPKKHYQFQLIFSLIFAILFFLFLSWQMYQNSQTRKISQELFKGYNITTLYGTNENMIIEKANAEQTVLNPFVIGILKIDKIHLNYPILSQSSRDLLKISLCRFAGPMPYKTGNLCIAGHNLVDNHFFSLLHDLELGDLISVFDLSGVEIIYEVYDKYEVIPSDLSCTSQEVENNRIITLLTCNNVNGRRLVVKAKEHKK